METRTRNALFHTRPFSAPLSRHHFPRRRTLIDLRLATDKPHELSEVPMCYPECGMSSLPLPTSRRSPRNPPSGFSAVASRRRQQRDTFSTGSQMHAPGPAPGARRNPSSSPTNVDGGDIDCKYSYDSDSDSEYSKSHQRATVHDTGRGTAKDNSVWSQAIEAEFLTSAADWLERQHTACPSGDEHALCAALMDLVEGVFQGIYSNGLLGGRVGSIERILDSDMLGWADVRLLYTTAPEEVFAIWLGFARRIHPTAHVDVTTDGLKRHCIVPYGPLWKVPDGLKNSSLPLETDCIIGAARPL